MSTNQMPAIKAKPIEVPKSPISVKNNAVKVQAVKQIALIKDATVSKNIITYPVRI